LNAQFDLLQIARSYVHIEGIGFQGGRAVGVGRGIVVADTGKILTRLSMNRCLVRSTGSYCLHAPGGGGTVSTVCNYTECDFSNNYSNAAIFIETGNTYHLFNACRVYSFVGHGVKLVGADGISLVNCAIETGDNSQPWLYATSSTNGLIDHGWFEDHAAVVPPAPNWFVFLDAGCHGWIVSGCTFRRGDQAGIDPRAIQVGNITTPSRSVLLLAPHMLTAALGGPGATNYVQIAGMAGGPGGNNECDLVGGIAQNVDGTSVVQVRVLDQSTKSMAFGGTLRIRPMRLSDAEAAGLAIPDIGQLYYNTTKGKMAVYMASGWKGVTTEPL
jgi:hypothetical protein